MRRARILVARGKSAEGRAELDRALQSEPRSLAALLERARLFHREGDGKAALADLDRAVEVDRRNDAVRIERGWVLVEQGLPASALEDFAAALESATSRAHRASALCGEGVSLAAKGDEGGARRSLDAALEADIDCGRAYLERGRLHARAGRFVEAERDFTQAVRRDATGVESLLERARARHAFSVDPAAEGAAAEHADETAIEDCKLAAGRAQNDPRPALREARYAADPGAALEAVNRALVLAPSCGEALALRGWLRLGRGDLGAEEDFEAARDALDNPADPLAGLAAVALRKEDLATALARADEAIAADAANCEAHGCRAHVLTRCREWSAARAEHDVCERLAKDTEVEGITLARIAAMWDAFHLAIDRRLSGDAMEWTGVKMVKAAQAFQRGRPHVGGASLEQARALWMVGQFDRVLAECTMALRRNPYRADAYLRRARVRLDVTRLRDDKEALADADAAAFLLPEDPRPLELAARARLASGDGLGALEALGRAMGQAPDLTVLHVRRAECLRALGREEEARASDSRARRARPDARTAQEYLNLGRFFSRGSQQDAATEYFGRGLEEAPRSAVLLTLRGESQLSSAHIEGFFRDYGHAFEIDPAASMNLFASTDQVLTQSKAAAQFVEPILQRIVGSAPEDAACQAVAAVWYYTRREWDRALTHAEAALARNPEFAVMYSVRGSALAQKGELERARADLAEGARRAPAGGMPQYFLAQHAALAGDRARALELLGECVRLGFEPHADFARHDPAFAAYLTTPEFEQALRRR
ncbi:MAG: tetratricopeptide repeat protein [Planctomycetes bacterium]|nr:tetratricopeptide repeat protein [Planctomycetota bacterium]